MTGEEIIAKLKKEKPILQQKFGVKEIGVFGSAVHGGMEEDSDIDLLVDMNPDYSLFCRTIPFISRTFFTEKLI